MDQVKLGRKSGTTTRYGGMDSCPTANGLGVNGATERLCSFGQLTGSSATVGTSITGLPLSVTLNGAIKRRVYTNPRNGVFAYDSAVAITAGLNGSSSTQQPTSMWPPETAVDPAAAATAGSLRGTAAGGPAPQRRREVHLPEGGLRCLRGWRGPGRRSGSRRPGRLPGRSGSDDAGRDRHEGSARDRAGVDRRRPGLA